MEKRLKIDMEILQTAITTYGKSYEDFEQMLKTLTTSIENLKGSGWNSAASSAFFSTFDDKWTENMKMHMIVISHLKECLETAQSEYEGIYNKIPTLGNSL